MTVVRYNIPEDVFYDHRLASDDDHSFPTTSAGINIKQQIRGALANRERDYVLRLAAEYEQLIQGQGIHIKSTTFTPYQRFLVYCCSAYYKLAFGVDYITLEIFIVRTPTSQIPPLRIADMMIVPVPQELSAANQLLALKPTTPRQTTFSTAQINSYITSKTSGDDASIDMAALRFLRPREQTSSASASSQHSSPPVTGPPTPIAQLPSIMIYAPPHGVMTFAQRQAAYEEARRRIFISDAEENVLDDDGNSESHSNSGETDVFRLAERDFASGSGESMNKAKPSNVVRGLPTKKVPFQPAIVTNRIINWGKHVSPQIPETPVPIDNTPSHTEDLDSTSFSPDIPNQAPIFSDEKPDLGQAITFPFISGQNSPASSESEFFRKSSPSPPSPLAQPPILIQAPPPIVVQAPPSIVVQAPPKHTMTLADRQAAYEEARRRIFVPSPEEEDHTVHEGNSGLHSININIVEDANDSRSTETNPTLSRGAKNAAYFPKAARPSFISKKVRFRPASDAEDLESETASMSGTNSIYSYASSRTKSTDYGLRYTSRALAEEEIDTIYKGGFWASLPV